MKCDRIQELLLTDYVDDCLDPSQKKEIDEHIGRCAHCMSFKQAVIQTTVEVFKGMERRQVPADLWGKIEASLESGPEHVPDTISWRESIRALFANRVPVYAMSVLLLFIGLGMFNQRNIHQVKLNQQSQEFLVSVMNASSSILISDGEDYGTNVEQMFL